MGKGMFQGCVCGGGLWGSGWRRGVGGEGGCFRCVCGVMGKGVFQVCVGGGVDFHARWNCVCVYCNRSAQMMSQHVKSKNYEDN